MIETSVARIREMEAVYDKALAALDELEKSIERFAACQADVQKLEDYYTGEDWRTDLALDEAGELPGDLKRGVLSQDGIYDLLERSAGLMGMLDREER